MLQAHTLLTAAPPGAVPAGVVRLACAERRKPRQLVTLEDGTELAIVLPRGTVLSPGAWLQTEDGGLIRVEAAPQAVLVVTAPDHLTLTRAAYHLGNRHTPVEIGTGYLRLEADPVLREMLIRLGTRVEERNEPFEPETGAYGGGHRHGGEETFAEDYALAQRLYEEHAQASASSHLHTHTHTHTHTHAPAHAHVHPPDESSPNPLAHPQPRNP
ncbi:MAG: urease accessory protein UreE [Verrucomicrobia bacterium]|nr:urease accessory protein UreE [Verrucomicrobiota bacterium]